MSVKYFFEDNAVAALSTFFSEAYPNSRDLVYVGGDANIYTAVESFLREGRDNFAVVYLDLVPDNMVLRMVYSDLSDLSKDLDYRCIVFPIVCAEYYYIKHLLKYGVCKDVTVLAPSISQRSYPSKEWLSVHNPKSYSNYEHLCKLYAERFVNPCASIPRTGRVKQAHRYTTGSCLCDDCNKLRTALEQKALEYVKEFPYPPYNPKLGMRKATEEERWEAHRKCVAAFNAWSDELSKTKPCFKITPIK